MISTSSGDSRTARDRQIGRRQGLGDGHGIRLVIVGLAAKSVAGAAEAADHFIVHQEDAVFVQHLGDGLEIALRRQHGAARAHHRFHEHGGDGVRAFALDGDVELVGQALGILFFRLAIARAAIVMRLRHPHREIEGQIEALVKGVQPRQRGAGQGDAVIGLVAGDDLLAAFLPARIGRVPHQLDLAVIGFGAGIGEEHLAHRKGRHLFQLLRQGDGRLMALAAEDVGEGELAHLLHRGLHQFFLAPAQRRAPQPAHGFQIILAVGAIDEDALAALQHQGPGLAQHGEVGEGMQQARHVASLGVGQMVTLEDIETFPAIAAAGNLPYAARITKCPEDY